MDANVVDRTQDRLKLAAREQRSTAGEAGEGGHGHFPFPVEAHVDEEGDVRRGCDRNVGLPPRRDRPRERNEERAREQDEADDAELRRGLEVEAVRGLGIRAPPMPAVLVCRRRS